MKRKYFFPKLIGMAIAVLCLVQFAPVTALAESGPPAGSAEAPSANSQSVKDSTIKKAAVAMPKIQQINDQTRSAMQQATTQQQRSQILSQARTKQLSVLHDAGITVVDYEKVLIAANSDPSVKSKLESYLRTNHGQ